MVKFGGSSLSEAKQFKKVYEIIKADPSRRFVVPSAPGKRFDNDTKVTDMLYNCYELASTGKEYEPVFQQIKSRYNEIIEELGLELSLDEEFDIIKGAFLHKAGRDYAASRGEYLNGIILAKYLDFEFIDAAEVIFFNENGTFADERTNSVLRERLSRIEYAVIPGFYGSMPNDTIKTFSRGGSDVTGSIVARAAMANLYENWTDVSGFMVVDPRIVKNPATIGTITYRELRELSYMGATVLHEDAIFPVRKGQIPINIRNTNKPDEDGTMIVYTSDKTNENVVTGIAGKKGFSVINLEKDRMNSEIGFGRRVLEVIEENGISFEHLPSGIDTMSIIVSSASVEGKEKKLLDDILMAVHPDKVDIETGLALIAIVGRGMKNSKGTAAKLINAVAEAKINIKMIDQGSSEMNIILAVNEYDFESAIKCIYNAFFE